MQGSGIFKKTVTVVLVLCLSLFCLEALYFAWVARQPSEQSDVDAIVVFYGSLNRVRGAYDLVKQGVAPQLIISPASWRYIKLFEKRFGALGKAAFILEEKAETTFTNAFYSAQRIRENDFRSVLLVTSDYHMPRSFLLLKLNLLDAHCRIGMFKLDTRIRDSETWPERIARLKMTYNEMIQLWGSLLEGGLHVAGGPNAWLRNRSSGVSRWLREHLLFNVPCLDCGDDRQS